MQGGISDNSETLLVLVMVGRETVEYFYGNIKAQESAKISPLQEQTLTSMCKASSERDCGTELCHPPLRQDKTRNS